MSNKSAVNKLEFQSPKRFIEPRISNEGDHPFLKKIGVLNNNKLSHGNSAKRLISGRKSQERIIKSQLNLKEAEKRNPDQC